MKLEPREKIFVAIGGIAVVFLVLWIGIYEPVVKKLADIDRKIDVQSRRYDDMVRITQGFKGLKETVEATEKRLKRPAGFSILSFLENLAVRTEVKDRIAQMKPRQGQTTKFYRESLVEIKMEKVSLDTLVRYLREIEAAPELLRVKELRIKPRFDNANLVDGVFTVSAYDLAEGGPG